MAGERDTNHHPHPHPHHHQPSAASGSSRLGLRVAGGGGGGGEIVEVQGGHIVRSTGRKDRHSKVCTAKGPRDRRVRLSAHTAIQFYDVQDRLGYDRPSKAVDWLIKKAKAAIDELDELPAWHPTSVPGGAAAHKPDDSDEPDPPEENSGKKPAGDHPATIHPTTYEQRFMAPPAAAPPPPGMDSDTVIADTIKSFFPMVAATTAASIPFRSYPPDLLSRTSSGQAQDLRLSLHSFPEPMLLPHSPGHPSEQSLFSTTSMSFDGGASSSWSEQHHDMARYWSAAATGAGGFMYSTGLPPVMAAAAAYQGQGQTQAQLFPQRGPLQSSNSPQVRAWPEPAAISDHSPATLSPHSSIVGFASGGFSGFRVPARFQGEEEHDPVGGNKPPAGSSAPRH